MRFPEWLYRLLDGDVGQQELTIVWRKTSSSATATTVAPTLYTVPGDKVLMLTNVTARFTPGAGQTTTRRRIKVDAGNSVAFTLMDNMTPGAAAVSDNLNWSGEVAVPPRWKVFAEGLFSAAANANAVEIECHGYLIPRGTFVGG